MFIAAPRGMWCTKVIVHDIRDIVKLPNTERSLKNQTYHYMKLIYLFSEPHSASLFTNIILQTWNTK